MMNKVIYALLDEFNLIEAYTGVYMFTIPFNLRHIPATVLKAIQRGWGKGYIVVHKTHKLYEAGLDNIEVQVHGGITYLGYLRYFKYHYQVIKLFKRKNLDDYYVIGFDTAHYKDNKIQQDKEYVESETKKLRKQIILKYS